MDYSKLSLEALWESREPAALAVIAERLTDKVSLVAKARSHVWVRRWNGHEDAGQHVMLWLLEAHREGRWLDESGRWSADCSLEVIALNRVRWNLASDSIPGMVDPTARAGMYGSAESRDEWDSVPAGPAEDEEDEEHDEDGDGGAPILRTEGPRGPKHDPSGSGPGRGGGASRSSFDAPIALRRDTHEMRAFDTMDSWTEEVEAGLHDRCFRQTLDLFLRAQPESRAVTVARLWLLEELADAAIADRLSITRNNLHVIRHRDVKPLLLAFYDSQIAA